MHEEVFAGLGGDEAVALVGVEPFHGSNSHVLVPPSIVLEVSTNADATLAPTARDKLDLQTAKQNVNLCQLHGSGRGHCPATEPRSSICRSAGAGCAGARDSSTAPALMAVSRAASRGRRGDNGNR